MTIYDDYFTHDDKPFAENINDALLLSNVFDLTVPVEVPRMFSNSTWVNSTSQRKCSVAIVTLKESLPSGVSVSTSDGKSVLTGTGTVKLGFYPNFASFGKYKSISWTATGSVTVNLKTSMGTTIASNIANGTITSESSELRQLQEIVIEIVLSNATLIGLTVVMENKQQERYGADVGISDVTGLQSSLDAKVNVSDIKDNLTSTDTNKPLSAKQGKELKTLVDGKANTSHTHDDRYYTETEIDGKLGWTKHNYYNGVDGIDLYYNDMFYCLEFNSFHYGGRIDIGNNVLAGFSVPTGCEPNCAVQTESVGSRITSIYVNSSGNIGVNYNGNSTVYEIIMTGTLIWRRI